MNVCGRVDEGKQSSYNPVHNSQMLKHDHLPSPYTGNNYLISSVTGATFYSSSPCSSNSAVMLAVAMETRSAVPWQQAVCIFTHLWQTSFCISSFIRLDIVSCIRCFNGFENLHHVFRTRPRQVSPSEGVISGHSFQVWSESLDLTHAALCCRI